MRCCLGRNNKMDEIKYNEWIYDYDLCDQDGEQVGCSYEFENGDSLSYYMYDDIAQSYGKQHSIIKIMTAYIYISETKEDYEYDRDEDFINNLEEIKEFDNGIVEEQMRNWLMEQYYKLIEDECYE